MSIPRHIHVRAARDRVIDLLGFGETYPLQDVGVQGEQLTVSFEQPAAFAIQPGQKDVHYELWAGESAVVPACSVDGAGDRTVLPGPIITADSTFRIRAFKIERPARSAFLSRRATVKVGLDLGLRAWIHGVPRLHPELVNPTDSDPCIADHGSVVEVRVAGSQPGARYELVSPGPGGGEIFVDPAASASQGELSFFTRPVEEDTLFRILVTRKFDPNEGRQDLVGWLRVELPLAVRANPGLAVAIDGSALVDPVAPVTITIAGSQASVLYGAYVRTLHDMDFVREDAPAAEVLTVRVPASKDVPEHPVQVHMPPRPTPWQAPADATQPGEPTAGNGAELKLALGPLAEDSVVVIQAQKVHVADGVAGKQSVLPGHSTLQLQQALVALSRPDPTPALTLTVSPNADGARGSMLVSGGQRGVFYHFRVDADGQEVGLPAYFHRLDEEAPQQNRGIGQLEIRRDLAVARDPLLDPAVLPVSPEQVRPPDPLIDVEPLPGGEVSVTAVKARTGVAWLASRPFPVTRTPES